VTGHGDNRAEETQFDALLERSSLGAPGARQLRSRIPLAEAETILRRGNFEEFFRASFRDLVRTAMIAGATLEEAEDAAAKTLSDMLPTWPAYERPFEYARRAVIHNFIKDKTRGNRRVARRLIERGHVPQTEDSEDDRLTAREDDEWVASVLSVLPPAQRAVMDCIARGLDREETAKALGMSREKVRRHLADARVRLVEQLHPESNKQPGH
jgi:RNA polymerase sigma factor (sigma-70 family)